MTEVDYANAQPAPAGPLSAPDDQPPLAPPTGDPIQLATGGLIAGPGSTTDPNSAWFGGEIRPIGVAGVVMGNPQIFGAHNGGPVEVPPGFQQWAQEWVDRAGPEVQRKAAEYGSNSLARKGRRYARAQGRSVSSAEALELGAAQYVLEKLDRVEDSMLRQQLPSDDTWTDVAVYALMCLYIRQNGRWL